MTSPASSETRTEVSIATGEPDWSEYLAAHPGATVYHDGRWGTLMASCYGNRPYHLTATRSGQAVGVLQLVWQRSRLFGSRLCSTPYFDAGGILADDAAAAEALLARAHSLMGELDVASVELRQVEPLDAELPTRTDKVTFWLELPAGSEAMWDSLKTKVRTKIRKAQREDFQVDSGGAALLDDFFGLYLRGMRDLGSPSHSRRFFRLVLEAFPHASRIFVVRRNGRALAAAFTMGDRLAFRVPWSSSDPAARRAGANRLLFWSMLAFAADAGAPRFDFGRSSRGSGTHEFKSEWKPETVPLHWHYLLADGAAMPGLSMENPRYRLLIEAWKKLPLPVAERIGPRVIGKLS